MDLDKTIKGRRSIRRYREQDIPDSLIEELLDLARYAPSSMNGQPWYFIVIRNDETKRHVVDAYMQFIPPGSRSGKHRHMSEEYIFVLEGKGYDLHWDVDFELADKYYWKVDKEPSRWEWEQGDSIYIPPNTVHQHFNRDREKPLRFISATSRAIRYIGFDDLEQIEDAPEYKEMPIRSGTQDL